MNAPDFSRRVAMIAGLIAILALALAAPALAVPSLEVEIEHTPETMPRNDEQMSYLLWVRNASPAQAVSGETLTCDANPTGWFLAPTFAFQWLSNGAAASGPVLQPTPSTSTYVVQPADQGKVLQCIVLGSNPAGTVASFTRPLPVSPPPAAAPPAPAQGGSGRPTVTGEFTANERTCVPPASWTGSPAWTFQWLRDGAPIPGATTATYLPQAGPGEPDEHKALQCQVTATNAGGTALAISRNSFTALPEEFPAGLPPNNNNGDTNTFDLPFIEYSGSMSGSVEVELELPAGQETRAFAIVDPGTEESQAPPLPTGWSCVSSEPLGPLHASVTCSRADRLEPGDQYPVIKVKTSVGPDAPDPLVARATVSGGGAPDFTAEDEFHFSPATPFAIESFTIKVADAAGSDYTQAGGHPFSANTTFALTHRVLSSGNPHGIEDLREVVADLPPGFVANPEAAPQRCDSLDAAFRDSFAVATCPRSSIIGRVDVTLSEGGFTGLPLYLIKPERGVPAGLAFVVKGLSAIYSLTPSLRADDGYAITVKATKVTQSPAVLAASVTLCGYGVDVGPAVLGDTPEALGCKNADDPGANPKPLVTNPTACLPQPPVTTLFADTWSHPGAYQSAQAVSPSVTGCDKVPFGLAIQMQPTSRQADSPTGLDVSITVPTEGLETPGAISQAALKRAVVKLPAGMSLNPGAADGLGACGPDQIRLGTNDPVGCPESSKVGSVEIVTPLLADPLQGNVYLARQRENPFGSLLALYLVAESKERGILVKIPGKVEARPDGQLVTTFDNNPQVPFSNLKLHFNSGSRAPLLNPRRCGSYGIESNLSPWSAQDPSNPTAAESRVTTNSFQVDSGPGGGRCPADALEAKLKAGVLNPVAASTSPFVMSLSREDGSQRFGSVDLTMPPGLTAYLKNVPYCSDAALAGISGEEGTGAATLTSSPCPAASQIGKVSVGVGGGSNPYYVDTGRAYMAGPYKGAPLSIAIVAPAVAGPFDLGTVVVRSAAYIDRETAQITVKSDPIPIALHGIPLDVREVRISVDRPDFILAPSNCEAMSVAARVQGDQGGEATVANRFQVGECAALGFKPGLSLRLKGGSKRGQNPALTATVTYPKGAYANIKRVSVALPHSEFLDQSHIGTVCTRVQFAANACPRASVYGSAEATSPLLDYKLRGPVYLRSSSHKLPDLVIALRGPDSQPIEIDLAGRIDSVDGGIRNSFETVPDAPVSKFVLRMRGGKKGLLVNSRNICKSPGAATVKTDGQNGKVHDFRSVLRPTCKGKAKKARKK